MAKKEVDIGIEGNDGTGDSIRESFRKVNDNFTELYAVFGLGGSISFKNIDDTPDSYLGNAGGIVAVNSTETGMGFYKYISDALDNADTRSAGRINNSVVVEFDDVDPSTPDQSGTVKIIINDPHIERDPDPRITAPADFQGVPAYSVSLNNDLRNTSGTGADINTLVTDWNTTHTTQPSITTENIIPTIGYNNDSYVNLTGDTMTGALEVPAGASGAQVPRTEEVITRAGSEVNRRMLDTLYLADHPNPIEGFGTPNGKDDLQAVTKLYVDTQGYSSATNIYVATNGNDEQTSTPAGQEGRAPQYSYKTINAAMRRAEEIIDSTPFEPGPYVQTVTYDQQSTNTTVSARSGYISWAAGVETTASTLIDDNINSLQEDVQEYVATNYPDLTYEIDICKRDVDLIVDSVRLDVLAGATVNYLSRWAGLRYNANPSAVKAKTVQLEATVASIALVRTTVLGLLDSELSLSAGDPVYDAYADRFTEVISILNGTPVALSGTGTGYTFDFLNGTYDSVDQGVEGNSDLIEGKIIVGKTSGAKGIITNYTRSATGTTDRITVDLVEPILFELDEELEFGNLTRNNQVTVRVESGIYNEHMPIKLPENVSIKGDEFRRVVLRPKAGVSQSKWANTYFYRDAVIDNLPAAYSPIETIGSISAADPLRQQGTYNLDNEQWTSNGDGVEAEFTVVVDGFGAVSITATNSGDGFIVGEVITIKNDQLGSGAGAADVSFTITATGGGTTFIHPINGKNGKYGYHYVTDASNVITVGTDAATNPGKFSQAARLIELNKDFIIEETIAYTNVNYPAPGFIYNADKWRRDYALVIDGILADLRTGGRESTLTNQKEFFTRTDTGQTTERLAVTQNLIPIIAHTLTNGDVSAYTPISAEPVITDTDYTPETEAQTNATALVNCIAFAFDASYNPPLNNNEMDVLLCNDGTIVRNLTVQRHGGFMMVLDPEGQILTRSPYCQTGSSFSQSKGTRRNFAGGLFIDGYAGNMPITVDTVNSAFNISVSSPAGEGLFIRKPPTPFPFFYDGARYQVNTITNYDKSTGTCTLVLDETSNVADLITREIDSITKGNPGIMTFTTNHPFSDGDRLQISNVNGMTQINGDTVFVKTTANPNEIELYNNVGLTVPTNTLGYSTYTGGGNAVTLAEGQGWTSGTGVDIFVQSGGNRSMLANDFTQINDLGFGCLAINNALSELVSMFTYYCHTGYLAADGSQIRSIAGNNSYGFFGLVAEGADPDEIATSVNLGANMVFPAKTFRADGYLNFASAVPSVGTVSNGQQIVQGLIETTITGITQASPAVVTTSAAHNLSDGDLITINDVVGMTEVNGLQYYVDVQSPTTFDLYTDSALSTAYDSTTNTAYSSGGEGVRAANATATVSFQGEEDGSGNPTRIYVHTTSGSFNTTNRCTTATSTDVGIPTAVENLDTDAKEGSLFMYAYDLDGFPNNTSEVEVYHDVNLYQPYEITNASDAGFTLSSYEIDTATAVGLSGTYSANNTKLQISKIQQGGGTYQVRIDDPGTGATISETIIIPGNLLGGATPANDATVTITDADGGLINAATVSGTPRVDDSTPIKSGIVYRFNFGTGLEGTASNGLQQDTSHDTSLVIRHKQNFLLDNFPGEDLPVRPSTAFQFVDDTTDFTYRTIAFGATITDGVTVGADQKMVTFDSNFRYIDLTLDRTGDALLDTESAFYTAATINPNYVDIMSSPTPALSGTITMGNTAATTSTDGSRFLVISPLDTTDEERIQNYDMIFTWGGKVHQIVGYAVYEYPAGSGTREVGVIEIQDLAGSDVNFPALSGSAYGGLAVSSVISDGLVLKAGLAEGEAADITVNISTCRATGHDMLDIGTGGFNTSNYPERIYGEPFGTSAISTNDAIDSEGFNSSAQVQERNKGRVFTVMTDQDGFFRVGRFFTVDQGTGSVTFNAALVLTNIDGIGFKRGVRVNEFSNDATFTDAKGDAVPTQTAVEGYLNARLGRDRFGVELTTGQIPTGGGYLFKLGDTMDGTLNMGLNKLTGLAAPDPAQGSDAVNIQYFEDNTDEINDIGDVTVTGTGTGIRGDLLVFTGTDQDSENCNVIGDIQITYDPLAPNQIEIGFSPGSIDNNDISASAAIAQSKLNMNAATTRANASGITQADLGLASFDSSSFTATNGWIEITAGGIVNAKLANDGITIGSTDVSLGDTITALTGITTINHTGNITGPANSGADNGVSIGSNSNRYNTVWATSFNGTATEALYADLAENYLGDADYEPGTVLVFGGDAEVTVCTAKGQTSAAGVVTTNPAHLMNSALQGDHVVGLALQGRVPCKVIGKVAKGDMLVTSAVPGYAIVNNAPGIGQVIGKAVGTKDSDERGMVEVVVGRV
jgi:hypothetical protein